MKYNKTFKEFLIEQAQGKYKVDTSACEKLEGKQKIDCEKCKSDDELKDFLQQSTAANG